VLGTIARVDGRKVTITGTDGKAVTFEVTNRTKLVRDPKTRGIFEELEAGMRAVVTLGDGEEANIAVELRYSEKK
jgi:antitoxin component of MazEF toxin-antitoxin module